jgi:hypothetical protein
MIEQGASPKLEVPRKKVYLGIIADGVFYRYNSFEWSSYSICEAIRKLMVEP